MGLRECLIIGCVGLLSALQPGDVQAGAAYFGSETDSIEISGQTVIGTSCTYEAVLAFPACTNAGGRVFNEHQVFNEDKLLIVGTNIVASFNFPVPTGSGPVFEVPISASLDVYHHVAYVYDGAEERVYFDGLLAGSRSVSGDVGDSSGLGYVGAIFRDGSMQPSFIGLLDSLRLSTVARYTGESFTPPTGDMTSDADTVLLYNFNDAPGSTNVVDESPLDRTGTLGVGFDGATSPQLVANGFTPCARCCSFNTTSDVWDVSMGSVITNTSGFEDGPGENMFGDTQTSPEAGTAFFRDDQADGFVHFVEWQTPQPVTIRSISLLAAHDGNSLQRSFKQFNLYAFNETSSLFDLILEFTPSLPYGEGVFANELRLCTNVTAATSDRFRAEFVQNGNFSFPGPRIYELDGYSVQQVECVCVPPPPGMVAWWPGDGDATDIVGGNDGILSNGATFAAGKVGQAFIFDGVDDHVKIDASASLDVGARGGLTIDAWINPTDLEQHPVVEYNNGAGQIGVHLWASTSDSGVVPGALFANIVESGGSIGHILISQPDVLSTGVFQHVAVTYDKTTGIGRLYHNGTVVAETNLGAFTPETSFDLYFGLRASGPSGAGLVFDGTIDEVEIFDRALCADEILAIYQAGSAGKCTDVPPTTVACSLAPLSDSNPVGTTHSVTATVLAGTNAVGGVMLDFEVVSGPNTGQSGSDATDCNGQATFQYASNGSAGTDTIRAIGAIGDQSFTCTAIKVWSAVQEDTHDFAVIRLKAPKNINLKGANASSTKRVVVQIENRSPHEEVIPDLDTLRDMVHVTVESLGECPDLVPVFIDGPPNKVKTLKPKQKLNVFFEVTFTTECVNDPGKSSKKDPGREDYRYTAHVDHFELNGIADTHPEDDDCPRAALPGGVDNNAGKPIKDKGCGNKDKETKQFGADVLTDVVLK